MLSAISAIKTCIYIWKKNCICSEVINLKIDLLNISLGSRHMSSPDVKLQRQSMLRNVSCPAEPRHRSPSTRSTQSEPPTPFQHSVSVTSVGSNLSSSPSFDSALSSPKGKQATSSLSHSFSPRVKKP